MKQPNRLINEKSPYLLQHAYNPVDWYPWGEEAFERAQREDKPIFLSVGYSTCYWCHVMEREVFENEMIARLMNEIFVNVKVDREERPDVDRVYMAAVQAMTGSGGWPMSVFLTPALKPFYGATYIPPESRYGRPGFVEVVSRIRELWRSNRKELLSSGDKITEYLRESARPPKLTASPTRDVLDEAFRWFLRNYDTIYGGFGPAPKFPRPTSFNFLFRYYSRSGDNSALEMALETLRRMACGGMYDHIGGGFHRYATDVRWHVPHFEKMLYDQAQLAVSYLEAHQVTGEVQFKTVAVDILEYVLRAMTHREGGFCSAEDAESAIDAATPERKREGAFYVWTMEELRSVLEPEELDLFSRHFGVEEAGNVFADPHGEFRGKNILFIAHAVEEIARQTGKKEEQVRSVITAAKRKIFEVRERRPRPHLDDKVLTSWNGLMISAFARAYQILDDERFLSTARRAAQFTINTMYDRKSRALLRRFRDGEARFEGHLEDYAFLTQALLDLYEAGFETRWLKLALELTERQTELFHDSAEGGFYDTAAADTSIIVRTKEWYDGAEPTGNSIAALNLLRLSEMLKRPDLRALAEQAIACFGARLAEAPFTMPQFLVGVGFSLTKPKQIVIAGKREGHDTKALLRAVHKHFIPDKLLLLADGGPGQEFLGSFIPFVLNVGPIDGKATAYVCEDYACKLPVNDPAQLDELLQSVCCRGNR